jgi:hypothetical protein
MKKILITLNSARHNKLKELMVEVDETNASGFVSSLITKWYDGNSRFGQQFKQTQSKQKQDTTKLIGKEKLQQDLEDVYSNYGGEGNGMYCKVNNMGGIDEMTDVYFGYENKTFNNTKEILEENPKLWDRLSSQDISNLKERHNYTK